MAKKKAAKRRPVEKAIERRPVEKAYSETVGPLIVGQLWGSTEVPLSSSYADYAREYKQLAWVYASVFAVAAGLAIVPWEIWEGVPGKGEKLDEKSEPVKLLMSPNEDMTWYDLMEETASYLELGGDEYWEIARNTVGGGPPKGLYTLRPDRITIVANKQGRGVDHYRFRVTPYAKDFEDFKPKNIVHFLYFNPTDDWYGLSPLSAAAMSVQSERYTITYNQNFFKRDATPPGYLHSDQPLQIDQAREIGKSWRQNMGGLENKYKIPVMPLGLKFSAIGVTAKDMQFLKQRQYNREEILSVFGVPPVKVGLLDQAKYDNYQLQEAAFYRDTIQPKCKKVAGKITKFLRREWPASEGGNELTFRFDLSEFLTVDKDQEATRLLKLFSAGGLTPNQIIESTNMGEHFDGGDDHYVSSAFQPIGEEAMGAGEQQMVAQQEQMKGMLSELQEAVRRSVGVPERLVESEDDE